MAPLSFALYDRAMLVSRSEMTFDFRGAKFDSVRDRELLRWILSQFLYGEVTGIQVGHWLYGAPDLESARFLAKQAIEELQHVGNFLKVMSALGVEPQPAHPVLRFLATGMMGGDWAEHVALEMATGEGFVLTAFYALIDTLDHPEAAAILERACRQEEGHVAFGEQKTMQLLAAEPKRKAELLGANLIWMWGVTRLARYVEKHLPREHPVLRYLPEFLAHALRCAELRLVRMGLCDVPPSSLTAAQRARLLSSYGARKLSGALSFPLRSGRKRLTETYLDDP
ncbi:MAG TPA: ferritin-like domain-containing protein, partial [Polyangiales bacterium]|nr:ferritin-like domain-containing protein [Polyangiales bacterium]